MPRSARVVIPGLAHHITQRGNNYQDVFYCDDNRRWYLRLLAKHARQFDVAVLAYCLMTNHVHIAAVPSTTDGLAAMMKRVAGHYAQSLNFRYGRHGHLWHGRFYSCAMDQLHTERAIRYIEMNPVRAGMVRDPWVFPWSSAAAHTDEAADPTGLLDLDSFAAAWPAQHWRDVLAYSRDAHEHDELLRVATRTGTPQVSKEDLARLESRFARRFRK